MFVLRISVTVRSGQNKASEVSPVGQGLEGSVHVARVANVL